MAVKSLEQILDRVTELKAEAGEKDEVIRVQQSQIDEYQSQIHELETQLANAKDAASRAEDLLEKLSQALDA